jgi:penicillin-binding protein 1A
MGLIDRSKNARAERSARRAERRAAKTPAERAAHRMASREDEVNGNGPGLAGPGSTNGDGPGGPPLAVVEGGGEGDTPARPKLKKLRTALVLLGLSALALVAWVFGIMMAVAQDLPRLENRAQFERAENSVIYDFTGEERIATLTNNEGRILVDSAEIAPVMKEAVVAIEDERFYEHRGVDFQGIARAIYQDVLSGSAAQGASTITQQFVKNALAAQDSRTVFQKLREAALAYQLERQWSKDKIITEYLNSIYFGEGAYGIEAAAKTYFGYAHQGCGEEGGTTCASQLLPYEAAMLAAIISSPAAYSPRANPEDALAQRNIVLLKMQEQGYLTPEEYQQYIAQPIPPSSSISPPTDDSRAPYFTSWLRQQLVDKYGAGEAFGGGLKITSTIDMDLQEQVEAIASSRAGGVGLDTAIVVLDNETAGVRAMVGGYDYAESPFNLATNGLRQPGSSFKPFTLVAALEDGHSTSEVFTSSPQEIPFRVKLEGKDGEPKIVNELFDVNNYEDSYLGSASLATATTFSDNSVYAQLGTQVGVDRVADTARKLGIRTDLRTDGAQYSIKGGPFEPYNPAMILGGLAQGVTPLEMAHAYETIAEDGDRISGTMAAAEGGPLGIVRVEEDADDDGSFDELVEDKDGNTGENESVREQVISPETAATARTTLTGVVTSGTGERAQTSEPTWGKTGTTDDNGDAWFCGATPDITACVWVGHADSNTPMLNEFGGAPVDGGTIPALIFADVVNAYLSVSDAREAGDEAVGTTTAPVAPTETAPVAPADTAPEAPVAPDASTPAEPAPEEAAPAPAPDGGGETGGAAATGGAAVAERRR